MAKLTGVLTDRALFERSADAIWMPLLFVGLFVVRGLASFASSYLLNRISQAVLMDLRMTMFDRMLRWPAPTYETMPSSIVISKFVNEATNALNLAAEVLSTAVRDTLIVIGLLAMLVYYNWQLTLVTLVSPGDSAVAARVQPPAAAAQCREPGDAGRDDARGAGGA
jgi:subfamily B ATP-binding cassette protein MsbA